MKRILILAFAFMLAGKTFASSSIINAGNPIVNELNSGQPVRFTDKKDLKLFISNLAALESPSFKGNYIPDIKDVNARALKDFQIRFNDVTKVRWFSDNNGFISYFNKDGFNNRAFYDKNGRWQYSLVYYTEDKLPKDIRSTVRSRYFDFSIYMVEEVQTTYGSAFVVYLEDKTKLKILKVSPEGEMETMVDMVKDL
jgi:hypothetical protein